jgi:hypothetical protein
MTDVKTYHGSCHCGAVAYEATTALDKLMDCNCSHCKRIGIVMQPVAAADFKLLSGSELLKTYRFNTKVIEHLFCTECGVQPFSRGSDPAGNQMVMINVNCLEDAPEIDRSTIYHWDGRSA